MTDSKRVLFDLHCDTITKCMQVGQGLSGNGLHISLERYPPDWKLIQCMAVFVHDHRGEAARGDYDAAVRTLREQVAAHDEVAVQVRSPADLERALAERQFGLILTVEGGCVLHGKLESLREMFDDGVRMMTLTWNYQNDICGGADTNEGFSDFGREVVAEMERLGVIVDVSHLSDRGFWQLGGFATRPFVASHSNCRAVCGHRRNLTDDMIREIVRRGGLIGLNYYREFLVDGGETQDIGDVLRHAHHILELGGEDTLALGSDFDGADVPDYLAGFEKVGDLADAMERSGIPQSVVDKIVFGNAHRFFSKYMGGVSQ